MRTRLKIGIFTRPIDQGTSGSGFHLLEVLNHLLDSDQDNEYVLIHHARNENGIYRRCRELIVSRNPLLAAFRLRKEGFDIVHYNPMTILSPIFGIPSKKITTIHGASILFLPKQFSFMKRMHAKLIVPFLARRMDGVVTVSKTSASFINKTYHVESDNICLCYNAVSEKYAQFEADGNAGKKYKILHISKFSERKNPWALLNAFKLVIQGIPEAKLSIIGNGWDNEKVRQWIDGNRLSDAIVLLGFVSEDEKIKRLQDSGVFVFPSLYEGFGMPNLEAMACSCPVVTTRVFAIPEIVDDAALLVDDPNDHKDIAEKILSIMNDDQLRQHLIDQGLRRVKSFSWTESARALRNFYERIGSDRA